MPCYVLSSLFLFSRSLSLFNVTFHRRSISGQTNVEVELGKKPVEENLRDRLMPGWYLSVSGQGLLR